MQSLFYNKVLNISCNLLNSALKVKNTMILSVLVVYPHNQVVFGGATAHCRCHASQESTVQHIDSMGGRSEFRVVLLGLYCFVPS